MYCSIPKLRVLCSGSSAGLLWLAGGGNNAGISEKAGLRRRVSGVSLGGSMARPQGVSASVKLHAAFNGGCGEARLLNGG